MARKIKQTLKLNPTTLSNARAVRFPVPRSQVIQGRDRHPRSHAVRHSRQVESAKIKKALQHLTHGKDIFAYSNIRTNQVVYSFSRFLNQNHVLSQLIYHGKKTVPATLRKDSWIPYFSAHFATKDAGLRVYRLLRQFSVQRQLAPPEEMITNSEETLARKRPKDPLKAKEWDKTWKPRIGQIMMKKDRARQLMDQKSTSVADLAAILSMPATNARGHTLGLGEPDMQLEEEAEKAKKRDDREKKQQAKLSIKAKKRQKAAAEAMRVQDEKVFAEIEQLQQALSKELLTPVEITDKFSDERKVPSDDNKPRELQPGEALVLWTDLHDSRLAEQWPETVFHGETVPVRGHNMSDEVKGTPQRLTAADSEESLAEDPGPQS